MTTTIPLVKKVEEVKTEDNKSTFVIEPLYPGFGLTLGNALRRVLLSSLPGAAIEAVKIKGVEHEFSYIDWIKEDVVDIILQLKQVRINLSEEVRKQAEETGEPIKLTMTVKGAKDVKAGDFDKSTGIEVSNKDLHLATLTDAAAKFELEAYIGYGLGYSPTESREQKDYEVGVVAIDSRYTPIKRIGYDIENVRVGDMTNWDKLMLNIETDGTMSCKDAFDRSVNILVEQFSGLINTEQVAEEETAEEKEEAKPEVKDEEPKEDKE